MAIHCYSEEGWLVDFEDFLDYLIDDGGLKLFLGLVVFGATVFGFIFWNWRIMLIIVVAIILAIVGIVICLFRDGSEDEEEGEEEHKNYTKSILTNYKCKNCGATLTKTTTVENGKKNISYNCEHCSATYEKNDIKLDKNAESKNGSTNKYDLTDFEEEYFSSCYVLEIKPYSEISETTLQRKKNKKINQLLDEYGMEDEYDLEEVSPEYAELIDNYDYLCNIKEEFENYKKYNDVEVIKNKYNFYLDTYIKNDLNSTNKD